MENTVIHVVPMNSEGYLQAMAMAAHPMSLQRTMSALEGSAAVVVWKAGRAVVRDAVRAVAQRTAAQRAAVAEAVVAKAGVVEPLVADLKAQLRLSHPAQK